MKHKPLTIEQFRKFRIAEIEETIAALTTELIDLKVAEKLSAQSKGGKAFDHVGPDTKEEESYSKRERDELVEGDRVKVIRADKFFGRKGTIISPHGTNYWNIRLDRLENESMNVIIHKMPGSLKKIKN